MDINGNDIDQLTQSYTLNYWNVETPTGEQLLWGTHLSVNAEGDLHIWDISDRFKPQCFVGGSWRNVHAEGCITTINGKHSYFAEYPQDSSR